ncbi:MAG: hypothetical protein WKF84_04565 [Pyrinomonadaceae bacterium]
MLPTSFSILRSRKINWALRVLGRRPSDGLHEIETVFQTVSLCDRLSFEVDASAQLSLTSNLRDLPVDSDNLVIKAALALRRASGTTASAGARIILKNRFHRAAASAVDRLMQLSRCWRSPNSGAWGFPSTTSRKSAPRWELMSPFLSRWHGPRFGHRNRDLPARRRSHDSPLNSYSRRQSAHRPGLRSPERTCLDNNCQRI